MERNSLTFCTSSWKGRLGGAACSLVSVCSSDHGVVKEEAKESAPYSSCSSTCKGDFSFVLVGAMLVEATAGGAEVVMVVTCIGTVGGTSSSIRPYSCPPGNFNPIN